MGKQYTLFKKGNGLPFRQKFFYIAAAADSLYQLLELYND